MVGKTQNFNASINLGASIDPSMMRSAQLMTAGIGEVRSASLNTMNVQTVWQQEMKKGSSTTQHQLNRTAQSIDTLTHKQTVLGKQIRTGVLAEQDVADLASDYQQVSVEIAKASKQLDKLNHQLKNEQQLEAKQGKSKRYKEAFLSPSRTAWGKVKTAPGNMLESGLSMAGGLPFTAAKSLISAPLAIATSAFSIGSDLVSGVLALNRKTAQEYQKATQHGMSYRHYKSGSILAEQAGLSGESYAAMSDGLSQKMSSKGESQSVNAMLGQAGLSRAQMTGSNEQQLDTVMQAISVKVQSGTLTAGQGESLAEGLMGGEADKLMSYIISTGNAYQEVMNNADLLNNVTNDEAQGALESSQVISNLWTSAETALQGMAGELGKAFAPQMEAWESEMVAWIKKNKDALAKSIGEWVAGGGPQRIADGLKTFGKVLETAADKLKWLLPDEPDTRTPEQMDSAQEAGQRAVEIEREKEGTYFLGFQKTIDIGQAGKKAWRDARAQTQINVPDYINFKEEDIGGAIPALPSIAYGGNTTQSQTNHNSFSYNITMQNGEGAGAVVNVINQKMNEIFPTTTGNSTYDTPFF